MVARAAIRIKAHLLSLDVQISASAYTTSLLAVGPALVAVRLHGELRLIFVSGAEAVLFMGFSEKLARRSSNSEHSPERQ